MKLFHRLIAASLLLVSASLAFADEVPMININTADREALAQLNGIGEKKAEAIIAWRDKNGTFVSLDQLAEVDGIGDATVEKNREAMVLE